MRSAKCSICSSHYSTILYTHTNTRTISESRATDWSPSACRGYDSLDVALLGDDKRVDVGDGAEAKSTRSKHLPEQALVSASVTIGVGLDPGVTSRNDCGCESARVLMINEI
jgi:hypothetical protein